MLNIQKKHLVILELKKLLFKQKKRYILQTFKRNWGWLRNGVAFFLYANSGERAPPSVTLA